jgi:hypothetical protein
MNSHEHLEINVLLAASILIFFKIFASGTSLVRTGSTGFPGVWPGIVSNATVPVARRINPR